MKLNESILFEELDGMSEKINKIDVTTAKQEQHFKEMNGTIARHEKMFKDLYTKTDSNTIDISTAKGGMAGVGWMFKIGGIIVTVLSGLALTKSLGFW